MTLMFEPGKRVIRCCSSDISSQPRLFLKNDAFTSLCYYITHLIDQDKANLIAHFSPHNTSKTPDSPLCHISANPLPPVPQTAYVPVSISANLLTREHAQQDQ